MAICQIDNCGKTAIARGACHKHYKRWQITGNPLLILKDYKCSKEDCNNKNYARGLCSKHFNKLRRSEGYLAIAIRKPKTRFTDSIRAAKRRNLEWTITFEQFCEFIKQKCHYCSGSLPQTKAGLDRKDNELGYLLNNVVPCCYPCNHLRSDVFTYEEFVEFSKTDLFRKVLNRIHHKKYG